MLLGASHLFGAGVKDDDTFETIIENRLNNMHPADPGNHCEILNFGLWGRTSLHQIIILGQAILPFRLDTVMYVTHPKSHRRFIKVLAHPLHKGDEIPYPYVREYFRRLVSTRA